jgi:D-alanyl-D-alanine carboxypeptidase-like protein
MTVSQNGWPVVLDSQRDKLTDREVLGAPFPHGWLKGDVDVILTDLIHRLHAEVEAIVPGTCWGWFVKPIEGSRTVSNHSSGTAVDYNATKHPMGVRDTYSAADQARIRIILRSYSGVIRWGGDYTGRPDDMHFEINDNAVAVRTVADRIRNQGDDMTKAEFTAWMTEWSNSNAGQAALGAAVAAAGIGPVLPTGGRRTLGGSVNALVVPTGDPSANGVPNIIAREVQPIIDAALQPAAPAAKVAKPGTAK